MPSRHSSGEHADLAGRLFEQRQMHGVLVAPQAEHGRAGIDQMLHGKLPGRRARRWRAARGDGRPTLRPFLAMSFSAAMTLSSKQPSHVLEPGHQRRRQIDAGAENEAEMGEHRHIGALGLVVGRRAARRRRCCSAAGTARRRRPAAQARGEAPSSGSRAKVELTTRNSLVKMPSGGRPAMATTPSTRPQPSTGLVSVRPPMSAIFCVPLTWEMSPTAKKMADLVSECRLMCSSPAKLASGPPMPKAKVTIPICSIEE